ncbi:ParB N-terminal domain-containing protein [Thermodesulfobacteriota bacterium]
MEIRQIAGNTPSLINLEEVDIIPGPYCMSCGFDIKPLINSIKACGLINIPYVTRGKGGYLDIVIGYRRIMALKTLGWQRIPCADLSDSGFSTLELLILNLNDNLPTRTFNDAEKGMILKRLLDLQVPRKEIREHYMPLLNISSTRDLEVLVRIEELNNSVKEYIANGAIPLKTAQLVLDLDIRSRPVILQWISDLRFNFNQQLKFIEYITDISIKEERSIAELMEESQFSNLSKDKGLNTPQKAKKMIDLLKSRRFPFLTSSEKAFAKNIAKLGLPETVRVKHPAFFEAPRYKLEIMFKNGKEIKEIINDLKHTEGLHRIGDPWDKENS